ncbi:hypothetical protein BPAE_0301g00080 [Botrytis paeoniae]|uniref:Uncharacterized protein n=1 Tax=Botrytis paeoniae TaxID=278948 RepID=A0A4Z1FG12_9HELO|nr:hypothetical protein BPAE_0301g00080 [Botrytis paeoniae]
MTSLTNLSLDQVAWLPICAQSELFLPEPLDDILITITYMTLKFESVRWVAVNHVLATGTCIGGYAKLGLVQTGFDAIFSNILSLLNIAIYSNKHSVSYSIDQFFSHQNNPRFVFEIHAMNTARKIAAQHNLVIYSIHWFYEQEDQSMKETPKNFPHGFPHSFLATSAQRSALKTPESTNAQRVVEICHTQSPFCPSFPMATYILLYGKSSHPLQSSSCHVCFAVLRCGSGANFAV